MPTNLMPARWRAAAALAGSWVLALFEEAEEEEGWAALVAEVAGAAAFLAAGAALGASGAGCFLGPRAGGSWGGGAGWGLEGLTISAKRV